jgi:hypothetical protein
VRVCCFMLASLNASRRIPNYGRYIEYNARRIEMDASHDRAM